MISENEVVFGDEETLIGILGLPDWAKGAIIFAHGSGSSRHSVRNHYVAKVLQNKGFATLLLDLLTEEESKYRKNVFDINLLAERLLEAKHWVQKQEWAIDMPIAYLGASTGAGAALVAAANDPEIFAVVSRGGRPDLAGSKLFDVEAPTLLIVGGADEDVVNLNCSAFEKMICPKELKIIPGAGHLFEEAGALERATRFAATWFSENLHPNYEVKSSSLSSKRGFDEAWR